MSLADITQITDLKNKCKKQAGWLGAMMGLLGIFALTTCHIYISKKVHYDYILLGLTIFFLLVAWARKNKNKYTTSEQDQLKTYQIAYRQLRMLTLIAMTANIGLFFLIMKRGQSSIPSQMCAKLNQKIEIKFLDLKTNQASSPIIIGNEDITNIEDSKDEFKSPTVRFYFTTTGLEKLNRGLRENVGSSLAVFVGQQGGERGGGRITAVTQLTDLNVSLRNGLHPNGSIKHLTVSDLCQK